MNLGVFNRVNLKDSGGGMYSEWASLSPLIQRGSDESRSVLEKFSPGAGREVALSVVKQLAANLGISQAAETSPLNTDREVQWCMEVICFGLSLPLAEHDTVRDCVNVYCEWLSALYTSPKISVPKPIIEDPNFYARKIISHFHNLFVPRKGEVWPFLYLDIGTDTINRQAVLCHRVLRTLQQVARGPAILDGETWESLLLFLIGINDSLLAPPAVREDAGEQLCERVLGVLLEVWLVACEKKFPSPPLWRTLRESCLRWRHRLALIEQWNRVCLALTARLLNIMYGPMFPGLKISDEDAQLIPPTMSDEAVAQAWYRLLRTVGDPVDLCRPAVVSQTQAFLQYAITSPSVIDPCQHPCLQALPQIFLKAIKGIAGQVDAFLGISQACCWEECCATTGLSNTSVSGVGGAGGEKITKDQPQPSPTPPTQRRLAKSFSVTPSAVTKGIPKASLIGLTTSRISNTSINIANSGPSSTSSTISATSLTSDIRPPLAPGRPKCNTVLHLFGEWLFEAAFIGTDGWSQSLPQPVGASKRPSSVLVEGPNSLQETINEIPTSLSIDRYESGKAEAMGALCRIFCAKKTGEEIFPVYLARFYQAMHRGLRVDENRECGETLASILSNSADLFRLDLDGVEMLAPAVLTALELVLPDKDLKLKSSNVSKIELRRASIQMLISMLALPLHFQNLPIREFSLSPMDNNPDKTPLTFGQLKPRLMNLLINALQVESDPLNTHMLLGGLLLSVQDSATAEEVEQSAPLDTVDNDTSTNLLTSASSDSTSQISICSDLRSLGDDGSTVQDETPAFDSAHALFLRATYLVCHRLISSWKTDLNISLAALELLSGLARTNIRETDSLECKRAVKWLCDYITYQCWRPPPAHSKDLHSSIVAAFGCLTTWLTAHPQLLQDKDCLTTVLEVVELGVSGTKSVGKPGEPIKMKDEKELKPASMRVRDAADGLLTIVLEQVGYFPSACGAQSLSSLLDEVSLLEQSLKESVSRSQAVERFRYFVAENATMLAILEGTSEHSANSNNDPHPTVTLVIRGPFGRHAWTMQLRHLPRHKSGVKSINPNPGRPLPLAETLPRTDYKPRFFPDNVDKIPHCKVDESIPSLEAVMNDNASVKEEHDLLSQILDSQMTIESQIDQESKASSSDRESYRECQPPSNAHEFQTARLFLSHFGFIGFDPSILDENDRSLGITALDPSIPGFCADLESLDNTNSRTCDTVHIFYVKSGQRAPGDILSNVLSRDNVSDHFLEFLNSLGWPVRVRDHAGWTGHVTTSWRITPNISSSQSNSTLNASENGGSLYSGDTHVLYWADVSSEIAFIVPTATSSASSNSNHQVSDCLEDQGICSSDCSTSYNCNYERSMSEHSSNRAASRVDSGYAPQSSQTTSSRTMSLDLEKQPSSLTSSGPPSVSSNSEFPVRSRRTTKHSFPGQMETKIMVVWLESLEDYAHFPVDQLLPYSSTGLESNCRTLQASDVLLIYLHSLSNGLLRVKLQGPVSRINLATPLIDGMLVSRRVLGTLVRQTAINMARRKRLDNDSYHPPHVRRRLKVQDMMQKYKRDLSQPELLTLLFNSPIVQ
ncbi:ral GTPase-activating protein subunit beta isoform X3 [Diachasma alloeum]|uniref:ral GTPase-activating protein subunit beta isoform X3 n=1 Tax=Diachasma alloeum TaxID=454923 RepID=UPI000738447F|nr:ral GTPase-activating protein subunit beta isoform X3 [Diachasma alloeum]